MLTLSRAVIGLILVVASLVIAPAATPRPSLRSASATSPPIPSRRCVCWAIGTCRRPA